MENNKTEIQKIKKAIEDIAGNMRVKEAGRDLETIHMRGLDTTATKEEIMESIKKTGDLHTADIRMSELRPNTRNTQAVTITLERTKAEELLKHPYLRVGFSRANMERKINVPRCRKCWAYEHSEKDCKGPNRQNTCYKCGKEGHLAKKFVETEISCPVCQEVGHRAGSARCMAFCRAISQIRYQANRDQNEMPQENRLEGGDSRNTEPLTTATPPRISHNTTTFYPAFNSRQEEYGQ
ncbi:hypothetical protein NQ314_014644 [Rhamnusium bicolor]|uniref:CCHC-type domain-containing protein n=1 Tax=Rhamnusium bicolor TaxID=1586634 RepID=A0AAV8X159_9CUCU|nr:hypothetical protein NQ314_014644 [Rhamnusium bicolor]